MDQDGLDGELWVWCDRNGLVRNCRQAALRECTVQDSVGTEHWNWGVLALGTSSGSDVAGTCFTAISGVAITVTFGVRTVMAGSTPKECSRADS